MISGKTKVVGLLGWPVEHTMSPHIQNAAFSAAGLDYVYIALPVKPEDLPKAVAGLKSLGFSGVNVTVPHKVSIMPFLDALDRSAQLVGAVNTIVFSGGKATGYNTDMPGFVNSLLAENVAINGKRAVLIGAGGAARAVVHGFLENGAAMVTVGARDGAKAISFATSFEQRGKVQGCDWRQAEFDDALRRCDILVNCTPVGMYPRVEEEVPLEWEMLNPAAVVCDLIYNPTVTSFLARAAAAGHKTVGGAGMLVEQGIAAFTLWTGAPAPRGAMYDMFAKVLATKKK